MDALFHFRNSGIRVAKIPEFRYWYAYVWKTGKSEISDFRNCNHYL